MKYNIVGDNLQFVNFELADGEELYAEAGAMLYMSGNMHMEAKARGGLMKGIKRSLTGESFFMTEFRPQGGSGILAFGGASPGKIKPLDLSGGRVYLLQKDAFLCAQPTVELDIAFQKKLGAAFFGGEGFILEKVWGRGFVFIHACGDFVEMDLQPGQVLKVDTGNAVAWEQSIQYSIERAGNLKTSIFGGEGLFVTTLTGPGKVILQSMTLKNLAFALQPFMQQTSGSSGSGGVVGTLLGQ